MTFAVQVAKAGDVTMPPITNPPRSYTALLRWTFDDLEYSFRDDRVILEGVYE